MTASDFVQNSRRKLPHIQLPDSVLFITWRLAFTLPKYIKDKAEDDESYLDSFSQYDSLLDKSESARINISHEPYLSIIRQILENNPESKHDLLIKEHILKNIYGFEYMMAPYTVAHLKLSQYLKDKGYLLNDNDHLNVFLTNTLEHLESQRDAMLPALTRESRSALRVKDKPILVITGNPPYSYISKNNGEFISKLIKDYYFVDGEPLNERAPGGLQDDYVKFIRFAQNKIDKVEEGIVAIITNHSFLDNPTFRGMRQSLMQTFNQMYFLDLHGNAKKKEKAPDGSKDENVFDIEQGVCISIMIKTKGDLDFIKNGDVFGNRQMKYSKLLNTKLNSIEWNLPNCISPFYLFNNKDVDQSESYMIAPSINDIFKVYNSGVKTHRDVLVVDSSNIELRTKIEKLLDNSISDDELKTMLSLNENEYAKLKDFRSKIKDKFQFDENDVREIAFRPLDKRYIYYNNIFVERARLEFMKNMCFPNIGIVSVRQVAEGVFNHVLATDMIIDCRTMLSNKGHGYIYPLYLYIYQQLDKEQIDAFEASEMAKIPNIKNEITENLNKEYNKQITPEQIMSYVYAVLHSPTYRTKYADFLKTDFPRIPFTDDFKLFTALAEQGWQLVQAHLQKDNTLAKTYKGMGDYSGRGDNSVDKPVYTDTQKRLYINGNQYFDNVPSEVYNFYIGGYQVLNKYLKDRKGRTLTLDEINNVESVVKVLQFTIDTMQKIDALTRDWI